MVEELEVRKWLEQDLEVKEWLEGERSWLKELVEVWSTEMNGWRVREIQVIESVAVERFEARE